MTTKNNCPYCGGHLAIPSWSKCNDCSNYREAKIAYHRKQGTLEEYKKLLHRKRLQQFLKEKEVEIPVKGTARMPETRENILAEVKRNYQYALAIGDEERVRNLFDTLTADREAVAKYDDQNAI